MRTIDCQNIRREVDEMAPDDLLSVFATRHLDLCPECRTFSEEQRKLQVILSSLETVEAPGDFDFRLRARLAGEKAGNAHFPLTKLSFGLRAAALASLLVAFGSVAFLNLRPSSDKSLVSNNVSNHATPASNVVNSQPGAVAPPSLVATDVKPVSAGQEGSAVQRRRVGASSAASASARNNSRMGTRDMASKAATLIKASELNARAADFPIEASSQPMKVSLDNGRGNSRTISLPPVSYGSQRVLAQGSSPLIASARGSW
jgi:hypothetical protein